MGPRYTPNSSKKPKPKPRKPSGPQVTRKEQTPGERMAGYEREQRHPSGAAWNRIKANVIASYNGICHLCGDPGAQQVDHLIAYAEGGTDDISNLRPVHGVANTQNNRCPVCQLACNNIRGSLSVEAGRAKILRRKGQRMKNGDEREW